jgi:hypothetical protein
VDFNGMRMIFASYVVVLAMITWREIKNPPSDNPIFLPEPQRYVSATVAFGLLGLLGETLTDRLAGVLAIGLAVGMGMQQNSATSGIVEKARSKVSGIVEKASPKKG